MLIQKEIRVIALLGHLPKNVTEEDAPAYFESIARRREPCVVTKGVPCKQDAEPFVAKRLNNSVLGFINVEDKRYLEPLMAKSPGGTVKMEFKEYRWDEHCAPLLVYSAWIYLEDVKRLIPGEYWEGACYSGLACLGVVQWTDTASALSLLLAAVTGAIDRGMVDMEGLIKDISRNSRYDISFETTQEISDLCFSFEVDNNPESKKYKMDLQRISTSRRSKRTIERFATQWWPEFLKSNEVIGFLQTYLMRIKTTYKVLDDAEVMDSIRMEMNRIEKELMNLPYNLYDYIDSPETFFSVAFYTKITRKRMHELYSALVARHWFRIILNQAKGNNQIIVGGKIQIQQVMILGNIENNGGTVLGNILNTKTNI